MEQDARKLAEQLYAADENRCKPSWDDLQHGGACQALWTERAQALIKQQVLDRRNDYVVVGRLL